MTPVTARALEPRVALLARFLERAKPRALGLLAENGAEWLALDLAAERAGVPLVPLPGFFTLEQLEHAVLSSGMDTLFCDVPRVALALGFAPATAAGAALPFFRRATTTTTVPPAGTAKVTFTSGTTGTPKGVCLGARQQEALARAIVNATRKLRIERHLCLLPLAVLLENVAGARAALEAGAACVVPPLAEAGVAGAARFDPIACLALMEASAAQSVILLPQMLEALASAIERGARRPSGLRFAAVGGAKIAPDLILRARDAGLPAFEGYGLSECGSVVALNLPGADRPGSVGRPLGHVRVRIDVTGEIVVAGNSFLGYLGDAQAGPTEVRTGDLGYSDSGGFLHVEGRRKDILITSFGRNVAPEWPESELCAGGVIAQAAVFGDAQPCLCAVVVPAPGRGHAAVVAEIERVNRRLPDYARIAFPVFADAPFSVVDGTATPNGRPRREAIRERYRERIRARYEVFPGAQHAFL